MEPSHISGSVRMIRSDGEDPVKLLEELRHLRQENLGLKQEEWAAFTPGISGPSGLRESPTEKPGISGHDNLVLQQDDWDYLAPGLSGPSGLRESPTDKPVVQAASGLDQAAVSRAFESVDVRAVREFLERKSRLTGDIIEDLITKGGLAHLDELQLLTMEALTHPEKSIIAPRVLPWLRATFLIKTIQESIPQMSHHDTSHDLMPEVFTQPIAQLSPVPVLSPDHVISHGHILLGSSASANNAGVSPTVARGTAQLQPQGALRGGVCGNCTRQDITVVIRRIGPDANMMLCQLCFNMVAMCQLKNPPNARSGSSSGSGCSVSTRASWVPALDEAGNPDGHRAPPSSEVSMPTGTHDGPRASPPSTVSMRTGNPDGHREVSMRTPWAPVLDPAELMESRYGFNSSRAGTALVVALSKTAPTLPPLRGHGQWDGRSLD